MRIDVQIGDEASARVLELANGNIRFTRAMARGIGQASQEIVGIAVKEAFTGKGPFPPSQKRLGVVSGRLRKAIRATAPSVNLSAGTIDVSYGANVSYFEIHEFGFKGTIQVRGHTRKLTGTRTFRRGKLTKSSSSKFKSVLEKREFQGRGKLYAQVKPHSRKLDVPARAPLGTVLRGVRAFNLYNARVGSALTAELKR